MVDYKNIITGFLILLISSSIIYIVLNNQGVKIRIDNDKSTLYIYENNRWVISGTEYNKLYNGTKLINRIVSGIKIEYLNESPYTIIKRSTPYQTGSIIIDTYKFKEDIDSKELFPIEHTIELINADKLIYQYEVRNLIYNGTTIKDVKSPQSFGRNTKIIWDNKSYWNTLYSNGILKIKFRQEINYEIYNIRLFDPIINGINVSKIDGNCKNVSVPLYGNVTYNYTCKTNTFNGTLNPKYAWCWNDTVLGNGTRPLIFEHRFDKRNVSIKTIWWNEYEQNGTKLVEQCETIGYKVGNKQFIFKDKAECKVNTEDKCVVCDSKQDGNGDGICQSGESCIDICIDDLGEIKQKIRQDNNFISKWFELK